MAVFEEGITSILGESAAIAAQRGTEYADSWHLDNLVTTFTENTLKSFNLDLSPEQLRLVIMAALIDTKESRMGGPYKEDTVVDGINYRAVFAHLKRLYNAPHEKKNVDLPPLCMFRSVVTGTICAIKEGSIVHMRCAGDEVHCGNALCHVFTPHAPPKE